MSFLMKSSTAGRFPPIVMSSPCTVATICSPLIRPSHVNQCHDFSFTFARGDLRQHFFQRFQWRCRRIQLWSGVCFFPSRPTSRARWASLVDPLKSQTKLLMRPFLLLRHTSNMHPHVKAFSFSQFHFWSLWPCPPSYLCCMWRNLPLT